jgi:hypothetical protein
MPDERVVLPMCADAVKESFLADLRELLKKYGASIDAKDHYPGYSECGEDIRMTVDVPAIYWKGDVVREWCEIDLGPDFEA